MPCANCKTVKFHDVFMAHKKHNKFFLLYVSFAVVQSMVMALSKCGVSLHYRLKQVGRLVSILVSD